MLFTVMPTVVLHPRLYKKGSEKMKTRKEVSKYDRMIDITFEDLERLKKLLKSKKLTDKQKESLKKLIQFYFQVSD